MTTNAELIAEARRTRATARGTWHLVSRLADALEAADAQVVRLETWRARAINLYPELDDRASLWAGEAR